MNLRNHRGYYDKDKALAVSHHARQLGDWDLVKETSMIGVGFVWNAIKRPDLHHDQSEVVY
jgi:hypothetical protein